MKLQGTIEVAKDKSISHRGVILGSLATGITTVKNFLNSEDCLATIDCFRKMGVDIKLEDSVAVVSGNGINGLKEPKEVLDAKNSGTTTRLVTGLLSSLNFNSVITGDDSLKKRPMKRIIEPLTLMGAKIEAVNNSFCPMKITGQKLKGIEYNIPIASAQLKSSLILASLNIDGETVLYEKVKTRDHTERMLKAMGANIEIIGNKIIVGKTEKLSPMELEVPGDISSAAFFMVASSIIPGSHIILKNIGLNDTRTGIIDVLKGMNANIEILNERTVCGEKVGDISVKYSHLKPIEIGGEIIPRLIDEIPIIAVLATQAEGKTVIKEAGELRVKESDRIKAISDMLNSAGVKNEELEDGIVIYGGNKIKGAVYDSYKDHRIAMSARILSLLTDEKSEIKDFDCVNISFPDFENTLEGLIK